MITFPAAAQIWIAAGVTDMRRGLNGLGALVQTTLQASPFNGHIFVLRGRRGDLIKVLWFDGDGLCLFTKRLEKGRFVWPQAESGSVALSRAQLSMPAQFCNSLLQNWLSPPGARDAPGCECRQPQAIKVLARTSPERFASSSPKWYVDKSSQK